MAAWLSLCLGVCFSPVCNAASSAESGNEQRAPGVINVGKPEWNALTPAQQRALQPLAGKWSTIGEGQKRKWIAISANYASLAPAEQTKLHSRMTEWVSLSPQQRAQARLNFAQTQQLTPSQKAAKWDAYQALSDAKKEELARSAGVKPPSTAIAVKPAPQQKLAKVPNSSRASKIANVDVALSRNTLLPRTTDELAAPLKN
jgi:Protein of unknown function (DUF3106)